LLLLLPLLGNGVCTLAVAVLSVHVLWHALLRLQCRAKKVTKQNPG
jgi:hypothetical protein